MIRLLYFVFTLFVVTVSSAQNRAINFNKSWEFVLADDTNTVAPNDHDVRWRPLNLPHDWSIDGPFSQTNPATPQGGALPGGIGWYRKVFTLPASATNKNVSIEFDGIYRNSEVWINDHYLGKRPNGYVSFYYDLTPFLKLSQKNLIVVKVDNSQQPNSRWYSGSGIYRNVRLVITNTTFIDTHHLFITSSPVHNNAAIINIDLDIKSDARYSLGIKIRATVYSPWKERVASKNLSFEINNRTEHFSQKIEFQHPKLWSIEKPNLYAVKIELIDKTGRIIDEATTNIGIRDFYFNGERGFILNGKPLKILGVCNHHDLGALGAAVNTRAIERQLQILKTMGCNAIRTAHNPPAPELLDLCDRMGFLVIDEAFDMWRKKKNKYDYSSDFDEWHKKDLQDMIFRDRNHPCVIMWSIGNEIREQFDSSGISIAKELVATIKQLDTTRPVTAALSEWDPKKNFLFQSGALDIVGLNYHHEVYKNFPIFFPGQKFIGTENMSALATRGYYDFPSDTIMRWPQHSPQKYVEKGNPDFTVSAFDQVSAYWGSTHEETWKIIKKYEFLSGLFIWAGFDYLGEPTPYPWPARSSYFGIIDLAGFPKDVYYMYQSEWTTKPVLHLFPHWNWKQGQVVDIWAYYNNADEVELFLNHRSVGIRKKTGDELHVMWRVSFEPGVLKAVSRKDGKVVLTKQIKTAGEPAKIELIADKKIIKADGKDLSFITVKVVDKNGNLVPYAENLIHFSTSGEGRIVATDNGYQADIDSFPSKNRNTWKGLALVIVQSSEKKGNITLRATADGLRSAILSLQTAN